MHDENNVVGKENSKDNPLLAATRGEIKINNDTGFIAANGISDGDGSESDPYIIASWEISTPASGICIEIANTTKYFEIVNCTLWNSTIGIKIQNATNIKIFNNTIYKPNRESIRYANVGEYFLNNLFIEPYQNEAGWRVTGP
jgi:parallel beta-helix repeat protein